MCGFENVLIVLGKVGNVSVSLQLKKSVTFATKQLTHTFIYRALEKIWQPKKMFKLIYVDSKCTFA